MRLFIAIDFDKTEYFAQYQSQLRQLSDGLKVRYTFPAAFHLTLKFLGEVNEAKLTEIVKRLGSIKFDACIIRTKSLGVFPSNDYVHTVWIGLDNDACICDLQKKIDSILKDMFPEELNFKAHLTIERVKFIPEENKKEFASFIKKMRVVPQEFRINEFKLIESTLTKSGPVYKILYTFKCAH